MSYEKLEMLYEGKAKKVYSTSDPNLIIIYYKDDATAFNAVKRGTIEDKGSLNNEITALIYEYLMNHGIETHFVKKLNDREQLCKKVSIVPLEVVTRNILAGSTARILGVEEGTTIPNVIYELCYKKDALGDPLINEHHAVALGAASYDEIKYIFSETEKINVLLKELFIKEDISLVDFKIEFGKDSNGKIILADEITPDTCRLWDKNTLKKLDKDRFRRDLGDVREAYMEILQRLKKSN
jgi:phosphoribosylaminoimidazole-succinocarboxamide synthase